MSDHIPARPSWRCTGCGASWPCYTRRRQLLAEYTGTPHSLYLLMAALMNEAAGELPSAADDLHGRFLGWLRRADRAKRP